MSLDLDERCSSDDVENRLQLLRKWIHLGMHRHALAYCLKCINNNKEHAMAPSASVLIQSDRLSAADVDRLLSDCLQTTPQLLETYGLVFAAEAYAERTDVSSAEFILTHLAMLKTRLASREGLEGQASEDLNHQRVEIKRVYERLLRLLVVDIYGKRMGMWKQSLQVLRNENHPLDAHVLDNLARACQDSRQHVPVAEVTDHDFQEPQQRSESEERPADWKQKWLSYAEALRLKATTGELDGMLLALFALVLLLLKMRQQKTSLLSYVRQFLARTLH